MTICFDVFAYLEYQFHIPIQNFHVHVDINTSLLLFPNESCRCITATVPLDEWHFLHASVFTEEDRKDCCVWVLWSFQWESSLLLVPSSFSPGWKTRIGLLTTDILLSGLNPLCLLFKSLTEKNIHKQMQQPIRSKMNKLCFYFLSQIWSLCSQ